MFEIKNNFGLTTADDGETGVYFWALHGADEAWWSSDLKSIQAKARGVAAGSTVNVAAVNP